MEETDQAQAEAVQQQWLGTPLPSNQPIMESFWQSPTPTSTTTTTTSFQASSKNKTKKRNRLRQKTSYTYKTPNVQRSIEGYIQRTPTTERDPAPRGGSSVKEGGAATRKEKKSASSTSSSDRKNATIINYFTVLPRLKIDNDSRNENVTHNTTRNKRSPTGIG